MSTILSDVALVIGSLAVLIVALATGALVWRKGFSRLSTKVGSVEVTLEGIGRDVAQINNAVNNVPMGSLTLVSRVALLEAGQAWERRMLLRIAQHVGVPVDTPGPIDDGGQNP